MENGAAIEVPASKVELASSNPSPEKQDFLAPPIDPHDVDRTFFAIQGPTGNISVHHRTGGSKADTPPKQQISTLRSNASTPSGSEGNREDSKKTDGEQDILVEAEFEVERKRVKDQTTFGEFWTKYVGIVRPEIPFSNSLWFTIVTFGIASLVCYYQFPTMIGWQKNKLYLVLALIPMFAGFVVLGSVLELVIYIITLITAETFLWEIHFYYNSARRIIRYSTGSILAIVIFHHIVNLPDIVYVVFQMSLVAFGLWALRSIIMTGLMLKANQSKLNTDLQHLLSRGAVLNHIYEQTSGSPSAAANDTLSSLPVVPVVGTKWHKLLHKFTSYKTNHLISNMHRSKNPKEFSMEIANKVFSSIGKHAEDDFLTVENFNSYMPRVMKVPDKGSEFNVTPESLFAELIEGYGNKMSHKRLAKAFYTYLEDTEKFISTVNHLDALGGLLHTASIVAYLIVLVLLCFIVFQEVLSSLLVPLFTLLLSVSFIFANMFKTLLESCVFIFITRAYEVGDLVDIQDETKRFVVSKIDLLSTSFIDAATGQYSVIANFILNQKTITNLSRSKTAIYRINLAISYGTPASAVSSLSTCIKQYCVRNAHDWKPDSSVFVRDFETSASVTVMISIFSQHLWVPWDRMLRVQSEFHEFLRHALHDLRICTSERPTPIMLVEQPTLHFEALPQSEQAEAARQEGQQQGRGKPEEGASPQQADQEFVVGVDGEKEKLTTEEGKAGEDEVANVVAVSEEGQRLVSTEAEQRISEIVNAVMMHGTKPAMAKREEKESCAVEEECCEGEKEDKHDAAAAAIAIAAV